LASYELIQFKNSALFIFILKKKLFGRNDHILKSRISKIPIRFKTSLFFKVSVKKIIDSKFQKEYQVHQYFSFLDLDSPIGVATARDRQKNIA
jgi:hypothetical protein